MHECLSKTPMTFSMTLWPVMCCKILLSVLTLVITLTGHQLEARAATINAASCSPTDVQSAVNSASIGDTVHLPTCTYPNWNTTVTIAKQIILEGNGVANTVIQRARVGAGYESNEMFAVQSVTGFEMRNMTLDGTADTDPNVWQDFAIVLFNCVDFRIHHMTIQNFAVGVQVDGDPLVQRGVIDHNTFTDNYYSTSGGSLGYSVSLVGNGTWPALELGTAQNIFVEDNTFTGCRHCIASNNSSRYVFRYNQIVDNGPNGASIDVHGRNTNNFPRGSRQWEIYNNTLTNRSGVTWYSGVGVYGGTGVIFNNQIAPGMTFYDIHFGEYCSGSYPVQDQVTESYVWNNTYTGGTGAVTIGVLGGCESYLQAGRDYFTSPRPGYTPYTYPHPLTQQGSPLLAAPTNLRIIQTTMQ
jgi:hypothetical protein